MIPLSYLLFTCGLGVVYRYMHDYKEAYNYYNEYFFPYVIHSNKTRTTTITLLSFITTCLIEQEIQGSL